MDEIFTTKKGMRIMSNKMILAVFAMFMFFACNETVEVSYEGVESAGEFAPGEDNELNGSAYVLADDKYMDIVQASTDAYNARDWDAMKALYRDDFVENSAEGMTNYFDNEVESLNMEIFAMLPVKIKGSDIARVLTWSVEDRTFQNGSKERHNLFEIYYIDEEDKLGGWNQWYRPDPDSEFTTHGLPEGGKFFGRGESEYAGRPLVFSNRGEVETLEKMFTDYNNMDGEAVSGYFADTWTFRQAVGGTTEMTSEALKSVFDELESVTWTPFSMTPLKIKDTDPQSGVTVYSYEKRVSKDGTVWEKELVELFYFDLNGKISGVEQFQRDLE
tara:strand:- start:224 stop:1216 length:993 start_codon:yes stop_codon:yes gene_type:complete